jgi:Recombinase
MVRPPLLTEIEPAARPYRRAPTHSLIAPAVAELRAAGATSLRAIAAGLNARGIRTPRGVGEWRAETVAQLLARLPGVQSAFRLATARSQLSELH